MMVIELNHIVRGGEPLLRTGGMIAPRGVNMVRCPRSYIVMLINYCCLCSSHTIKQSNKLALSSISKKVGTRCRNTSYERFLEGCSSPFMRLAEHHGASRSVQAMSALLVKTRRAPPRHSRDARIYGHTTTAMHKLGTPPPHVARFCDKSIYSLMFDKKGGNIIDKLK